MQQKPENWNALSAAEKRNIRLEAWVRADGATILSILSDDNQSFLQRTLYLEFRLLP